jgi:hypothetical protein
VWMLGSPRSGSTWILRLLAGTGSVVPIDEPLIGWSLGQFLSDLPGWSADSLEYGTSMMFKVQADKRDQFFNDEFREAWQPQMAEMLRDRFRAHARAYPASPRPSRSLVVIKEPNGSQAAELLMGALPRSRLLFLLRDGRDVVDSELAANAADSWVTKNFDGARGIDDAQRLDFVTQSARKWLWRTEAVQAAYAKHSGPKLLLRYEDLRAEPERHLRVLLDWLGLDIPQAQLSELVERHSFENVPDELRGPRSFHRAARPGLWRENLTPEEQAAVARILAAKLRELSYED